MMFQEQRNALLEMANKIYYPLPIYMQFAIDEDEESGLEAQELPDGYDRLGIK